MSTDQNYLDYLHLDDEIQNTYCKWKHEYDEFWEKYNEEKHKIFLNCAREHREDAPWREITKQLTVKDIDFIREFKDKIKWEELGHEIKYDSEIYKEFKKEIDQAFNEKMEFTSQMIDLIMQDIV